MSSVIELNHIVKMYKIGQLEHTALKGIQLTINAGELVAIVGASGSGKSTLMNIIGLLDKPTGGEYLLSGNDISKTKIEDLSAIRNRMIGFVFQSFFLLPRLTVLQNVGLPLTYRELPDYKIEELSHHMLKRVGIEHLALHRPRELSGGQQQRVAIARALVGNPSVILADEPTGALDSKTGQAIMDLFIQLNQMDKKTIVIITHDMKIAEQCRRIIGIKDGLIEEENHVANVGEK